MAAMTVSKPLTVTVSNTDGMPKEGISVYAFNGTTYTNYSKTTDTLGQAVFTLPQGDYRFRADLNGTQFWSGEENHCTLPACEADAVTLLGGTGQSQVTIEYMYDALNRLTDAVYSKKMCYVRW
jgi:hypothetical protein